MKAIKNGMNQTQAASLFNISRKTIYNWIKHKQETGRIEPTINGFQNGHSHKISDLEAFKATVDSHPGYTLEEFSKIQEFRTLRI